MRMVFSRKGQNLMDLALIIGVVGLLMVGMETYLRRQMQGKIKDLTDHFISEDQSAGESTEATTYRSSSSLKSHSDMDFETKPGGGRHLEGKETSHSDFSDHRTDIETF